MSTETPTGQEQHAPATSELPNGAPAAPADGGVAPEQQTQQEPTPEAEAAAAAAAEDARKRKERNERFGDLTKQRNKALEEAAYWRGVAEASRGQQAPQAPQQQSEPQVNADPEPDPNAFPGKEFDPGYAKAVAAWAGRQEARRLAEEDRKARTEAEAKTAEERAFNEGRERFFEARDQADALEDANPQYVGLVTATLDNIARAEPLGTPGRLVDIVTQVENKAWVVAALGSKPGLLQQIQTLNPTQRAIAIGKIDAQISANLRSPNAPAPKPQAAAPASAPANGASVAPPSNPAGITPPPALNGKGSAVPQIDPNKASMEDYVRWRESMQ